MTNCRNPVSESLLCHNSPFDRLSTANDAAEFASFLSDPRIERILTLGKEINELLYKIKAASDYLAGDAPVQEAEEVEMAKSYLSREVSIEWGEAMELLPAVGEAIDKLEVEERELVNSHKMNAGLARIEGLSGKGKQRQFSEAASKAQVRVSEIRNLIHAFEALEKDISTARKAPHLCPRCASAKVSYRLTPSELGFTLFSCDECGNAWKVTEFSLRAL
jgi:DNA-directed RNA polymerase subunit M/transcription elongation factor TFIIS